MPFVNSQAARSARLIALLLALSPMAPAQAQAQNTAYPYSTQLSINDLLFEDIAQGGLDGTQLPMGSTLALPNGDRVEARASVGLGIHKAVARIQAINPDQPARLICALSKADWWDSVTISDPLRAGELGQFTTSLLVKGSGAMETIEYVGDPLNSFQQDVSFSFIFGQPFALGMQLST